MPFVVDGQSFDIDTSGSHLRLEDQPGRLLDIDFEVRSVEGARELVLRFADQLRRIEDPTNWSVREASTQEAIQLYDGAHDVLVGWSMTYSNRRLQIAGITLEGMETFQLTWDLAT